MRLLLSLLVTVLVADFYLPPLMNLFTFSSFGAHLYVCCVLATVLHQLSPVFVVQANMLEGGGKTPILSPLELEDIGFKIVVYPLSLVGVSIRAMQVSTQQTLRSFSQKQCVTSQDLHSLYVPGV